MLDLVSNIHVVCKPQNLLMLSSDLLLVARHTIFSSCVAARVMLDYLNFLQKKPLINQANIEFITSKFPSLLLFVAIVMKSQYKSGPLTCRLHI